MNNVPSSILRKENILKTHFPNIWGCVISSVLSLHNKDSKQQTSVAAWLQLSFIRQAKDSTPSRHEGRPHIKRERFSLGFSFYMFCLLPLSLPCVNWGSQQGCFTWGSHSGPQVFFCSIFSGFFLSLSFSHHHFGLLFPILTT